MTARGDSAPELEAGAVSTAPETSLTPTQHESRTVLDEAKTIQDSASQSRHLISNLALLSRTSVITNSSPPSAAAVTAKSGSPATSWGPTAPSKSLAARRSTTLKPFEREFNGIKKFEPISRSHDGFVDILQVVAPRTAFYYVMELADDQLTGSEIDPGHYCSQIAAQRGQNPSASAR
jgi:hypothetical protein